MAAGVIGLTLLAAFSMGSYIIPGRGVIGMHGWPQPIGWIARILVMESWPTYDTLEVRWVVWALGALALVGLAAVTARSWTVSPQVQSLLGGLAGYAGLLLLLVLLLAATSSVAPVGLSWTWQLATGLLWMLALYWWAVRLPADTSARAIAVPLTVLTAISLLYSVQGAQRYPNWPVGNVLLLTTACLAAIFLLGTRAYARLTEALDGGRPREWVAAAGVCAMLLMVVVAVSLSGRRAGILGLTAGSTYLMLVSLPRSRRAKIIAATVVLAAVVLGAALAPRLLRSGRWQTVVLREALYGQTWSMLKQYPLAGVGPGQLGAPLTSAMRPKHAASPRLFHGEVSEHAHSEPLHALAELGAPVGLMYLALPLGGLLAFAAAGRRAADRRERLAVLGLGAALAAVMAAEATSVGMRHPGVAGLLWGLVGIGYALGLRSGALASIVHLLDGRVAGLKAHAGVWWAVWPAATAGVCLLAAVSMAGSYHLNNGLRAWNDGRLVQADAEFDRSWLPPDADHWMIREYLQGRTNMALLRQARSQEEAAIRHAKAMACFQALVMVSPAYKDTAVWLGRAIGDPEQLAGLCMNLTSDDIDPYDREALLVLADRADDPAVRLRLLRASLRNEGVLAPVAGMIAATAREPAAQVVLKQWLTEADKALSIDEPARWPDPLSLETYRLAVIVEGERGRIDAAADAADRAAILCKRLEGDVWRRRREPVELETYLHQGWFHWLRRPESSRIVEAMLTQRSLPLIYGEAESFSARMTLQLLAMLELIDNRRGEAGRNLLVSEGAAARQETISRMLGLACARLVATLRPAPAATQDGAAATRPKAADAEASERRIAVWTQAGRRFLGEAVWPQALEQAAIHRADPWWRGVLSAE